MVCLPKTSVSIVIHDETLKFNFLYLAVYAKYLQRLKHIKLNVHQK